MQTQTDSFVPDGVLEPTGLGCLVIVARYHGLHLTVPQLIHDNMLTDPEVSLAELIKSASGAGLDAKAVHLTWNGLNLLKKSLPAIVRLDHGGCMVLLRFEGMGRTVRLVLQDPDAGDDALLLIDREWFEEVWTGEVVLVKRNYASSTIESDPSVPSDLRPGAQKTNDGVPTSLANLHPESRARGDKSHLRRTSALDEASVNLKSSEPLVTRSASARAKDTPDGVAEPMVAPRRGQIRARIGEAQTTDNTVSTVSARAPSVATGGAGQEHTLSQARTNLNPSSSPTRQFVVLIVGAAATVVVWVSILAIQAPILPSIANLVDSLNGSNVDRREMNKTNGRVEADSNMGPKSKNTTFLSTDVNDATRSLGGQPNQHRASTETPPAIDPKPLQSSADSLNRTETKLNSNTMADAQQLSNGDPPIQREVNKAGDRMAADSDIEHKPENTNFLSTNGNDATRSLDGPSSGRRASTETPPAIESKSPRIPADSVNITETNNSNAMADVRPLSDGNPPIQREINKTDDRMEVDPDIGPGSKNTNFPSTNGNDATRSLDGQSNQPRASTELPPAIESKSLQTPAASVTKTETNNLNAMADVQQLSNGGPPIQREIHKAGDRMEIIASKSKNTNFSSTHGKDATRSLGKQPNQRRAFAEKLPAIESKSLRTPADSVNRSEARLNLRTTADVLQVQQRLVELGYLPFLPDGAWGPHSIQALSAFRTRAGLGSGDQWDQKTEDVLFAPAAPKATAPTAAPLQLPPG
jgi:hypothetical protein